MQILMLSDVYFPRVNGVSTSIRAAIRWLTQAGHQVTLVAPDYDDPEQARHDGEFGDRLEVLRLPARKIFFDPEDRLLRADALRRLLPQLAARHWDVVHVHTPFRAHRLGARLASRTRVPVVETYHTYFEAYVGHYLPWLPRPAAEAFARHASRRLCNEVDHLVVPTEEMVGVLDRYGVRTPRTVLPTGIDLDEFAGGDGGEFRSRLGVAPGRPLLLTVSRLAREKNIEFLLRVVSSLVEELPELLFVVAGEGPDAQRLKAVAQELDLVGNVRFLGNLDRRTALLDCYRAADAFVFASPTETQGLVLIEAMALGVPIVSTAVMGTATVLRGAESACIAPEDVRAFAGEVQRLLRDPARRAAMAEAGPRDARGWSVEAMMQRMVALYADLAELNRPA